MQCLFILGFVQMSPLITETAIAAQCCSPCTKNKSSYTDTGSVTKHMKEKTLQPLTTADLICRIRPMKKFAPIFQVRSDPRASDGDDKSVIDKQVTAVARESVKKKGGISKRLTRARARIYFTSCSARRIKSGECDELIKGAFSAATCNAITNPHIDVKWQTRPRVG